MFTELKEKLIKTNPVKFSENALPTAINKEPTILKDYFTFANLPKGHSVLQYWCTLCLILLRSFAFL